MSTRTIQVIMCASAIQVIMSAQYQYKFSHVHDHNGGYEDQFEIYPTLTVSNKGFVDYFTIDRNIYR